MQRLRIGVLRGGEGEHHEHSMKEGARLISFFLNNLPSKYNIYDVYVDRNNIWHMYGIPVNPVSLSHKLDIIWDVSHPSVSHVLDDLPLSKVKAPGFFHTISNNENLLREHMKNLEVKMPRMLSIPPYQEDFDGEINTFILKKAREVWQKFSPPWVVKSSSPFSNIGIKVVKTFPELVNALEELVFNNQGIFVEELIYGKEARVHTIPGFRNESFYTLPLLEDRSEDGSIKTFSKEEKENLMSFAKSLHSKIGDTHYIDSVLLINPQGKIYLKKISFHPNIENDSHLHKSLENIGIKRENFIQHILKKVHML